MTASNQTPQPRFPVPEGFRLLNQDEIIETGDLVCNRDADEFSPLWETYAAGMLAKTGITSFYFRRIPAPAIPADAEIRPGVPFLVEKFETGPDPIAVPDAPLGGDIRVIREQFTRHDTELHPDKDNADYLEYRMGIYGSIISYGYQKQGPGTSYEWIKHPLTLIREGAILRDALESAYNALQTGFYDGEVDRKIRSALGESVKDAGGDHG